ncbi:hypothetical protein [Gemmobacter denitrificans]|uniref:STAS domain-containing protein n=1 Tax=Gemmobacter denitrificans TaxID=3123040 RepID=A0ABU8BSM9_9RHOB
MPYQIKILPARRLCLFRMFGDFGVKDGKASFLEYAKSAAFDPGIMMLTDAREIGEINVSFADMLMSVFSVQSAMDRFNNDTPSIVLLDTETMYGMARMLQQALALSGKIALMPTMCEAEALQLAGVQGARMADLRREAGFPGFSQVSGRAA